ncbi:MAG: ribonuclease HIII [Negativicutes bacterium]
MNSFAEYVQHFKTKITQSGLQLGAEKPVPYGRRIDVVRESEIIPVTLYEGKKGFSTVVAGKAGGLREMVEHLINGAPLILMTADKPYGFENVDGYEAGWIGTDESGKGDVFGPLVVAAVAVNPESVQELTAIGVKDCKQLSDKKVFELAMKIRQVCKGSFQELALFPSRYNSLYATMKNEGKNLNHLMAWAHARVIEDMLETVPRRYAIADKFADVRFIESRLMARGRAIVLIQKTHAEQNIAVAAASVLARDAFLRGLDSLSQKYAVDLPKGAGTPVNAAIQKFMAIHGKAALAEVGKIHFKTFEGVL